MGSSAELALIRYVDRMIRTGARQVEVPERLVVGVSAEALDEVRRLCKINGVKIVVRE